MNDNFEICPECNEQRPVNTPSCPVCITRYKNDEGHYGRYDLLEGWVCYNSCPICHPADDGEVEE